LDQFAEVDYNLGIRRAVQVQDAQLAAAAIAEHAVLVQPLLGEGDDGSQVGTYGGDGVSAFDQAPQSGGIVLGDPGIACLSAVRRFGLSNRQQADISAMGMGELTSSNRFVI
jgi:hypothetical protein